MSKIFIWKSIALKALFKHINNESIMNLISCKRSQLNDTFFKEKTISIIAYKNKWSSRFANECRFVCYLMW
jgi:hypothetical protein